MLESRMYKVGYAKCRAAFFKSPQTQLAVVSSIKTIRVSLLFITDL